MLRRAWAVRMGLFSIGIAMAVSDGARAEPAAKSGLGDVSCDAQGCRLGSCLTQAAIDDPSQLIGMLRVVPWFVDGQSRGFKLFAVRAGSLPAQLGVQNGDVFRGLNGLPVQDPATAQAAWEAARNSPLWRLSLQRGEQTIERTLHLDRGPRPAAGCPKGALLQGPATARSPRPTAASTGQAEQGARLATIHCQGARCTLPRSTLDWMLADQSLLMRSVRLIPKTDQGQVRGFALYGIRPASLFDRLGLKNGDLLLRIAEQSLDNPEAALVAYTHVRSADQIPVEIERAGSKQTRTYVIEKDRQ